MKAILVAVAVLLSTSLMAQRDSIFTLKGRVFAPDSVTGLVEVHVINKNLTLGTVSNARGQFGIDVRIGDTVVFSNISYQYFYHFVKPADTLKQLLVVMQVRSFMLDEVSIFTYELSTNREKAMKKGQPMIPRNDKIKDPKPLEVNAIASPIDYIYSLFSNREQQLRALQELRKQDAFREQLNKGKNHQYLLQLTNLTEAELEQMLFFCRYSRTYISTASDYELLISLLSCFEEYESIKKREQILDEWER